MTGIPEDPIETLRRAAEVAPQVLPPGLGSATTAWLLAEAGCHEAAPGVAESAERVLSSIAEEISGEDAEVDFSVTVSTLDSAVAFAREVLALADPGPIEPGPVDLTPEQVEDLKARFETAKHGMPEVLYHVTREQVRYLLMGAYGLGMDDAEARRTARGHEDLHRKLATEDPTTAQYLRAVGIPVQEGQQP